MLEIIIFLFSLHVYLVVALPGGPTPTPFPSGERSAVVPPPPLPTAPPYHELLRRNGTSTISANICGWIDGKINEPLTCSEAAATCLWNSKLRMVGCMTSLKNQVPQYSTACADYAAVSSSSVAPNVQVCPSSAPYCNTASFPASYSMFPCGTAKGKVFTVVLSGKTLPTPNSLPQYLGSDGKLFYEPVATDFSQKGSIIAACVGGGVLLLGLPFGIKMAIRKLRWRQAEQAPKIRSLRHPFVREQLPPGPNFLFSQEWHGTPEAAPAPPYPPAHLGFGKRS